MITEFVRVRPFYHALRLRVRVHLPAILTDDHVQDFVDQPQRVDLAGSDRLLGEAGQVVLLVDLLGELQVCISNSRLLYLTGVRQMP